MGITAQKCLYSDSKSLPNDAEEYYLKSDGKYFGKDTDKSDYKPMVVTDYDWSNGNVQKILEKKESDGYVTLQWADENQRWGYEIEFGKPFAVGVGEKRESFKFVTVG